MYERSVGAAGLGFGGGTGPVGENGSLPKPVWTPWRVSASASMTPGELTLDREPGGVGLLLGELQQRGAEVAGAGAGGDRVGRGLVDEGRVVGLALGGEVARLRPGRVGDPGRLLAGVDGLVDVGGGRVVGADLVAALGGVAAKAARASGAARRPATRRRERGVARMGAPQVGWCPGRLRDVDRRLLPATCAPRRAAAPPDVDVPRARARGTSRGVGATGRLRTPRPWGRR